MGPFKNDVTAKILAVFRQGVPLDPSINIGISLMVWSLKGGGVKYRNFVQSLNFRGKTFISRKISRIFASNLVVDIIKEKKSYIFIHRLGQTGQSRAIT